MYQKNIVISNQDTEPRAHHIIYAFISDNIIPAKKWIYAIYTTMICM